MQELLDILRCPKTQQPFQMADSKTISDLNGRIKAGQVKNGAGRVVSEPISAGFIREDRKLLYPMRNSIPVFCIDEAIPI